MQITDNCPRYSFDAHSRTSLSSCITLSSTPRNYYCSPSSRHGNLVDSTTLPPVPCPFHMDHRTLLWVLLKLHILHRRLDHLYNPLKFTLRCSEDLEIINLQETCNLAVNRLGLSVSLAALIFHASGFKHTVNSLGHNASPCGNPLLN